MIRLAWLQSRTQTLVAVAALAVAAVLLAITGPNLVHLYDTILAPCTAQANCSSTTVNLFLQNDKNLRTWFGILVIVVPGIVGIFWGAPLVAREIEAGTHRLAWTQSVTRTRWLAAKMGVLLLTSMAVAGVLSLMVTWWSSPLDRVGMNAFGRFDQRDIVPMGYAAFGFALGVTAGVLIRRTLPAMAAVAVVFTAARLAITQWVRPHLIAPLHLAVALDPTSTGFGRTSQGAGTLQPASPNIPNAWIYPTQIIDKAGHGLTSQFLATTCPQLGEVGAGPPPGGPVNRGQVPAAVESALEDCVKKVGVTYHQLVTYQPANRYWTFQWYELAIYLAAAAILAGVSIWMIRRRRS
jgi:hypothetical protein